MIFQILVIWISNQSPAKTIVDDLIKEEKQISNELNLIKLNRDLNRLEERKTRYGGEAPLDLLNQIETIQSEIRSIESK